jgi:hypothetical protein
MLVILNAPAVGVEIATDVDSPHLGLFIEGGNPPYEIEFQWKRLNDATLTAHAPDLAGPVVRQPTPPYTSLDEERSNDPRLTNDWKNIRNAKSQAYTIKTADLSNWVHCEITFKESGGASVKRVTEALQIL